MTEAIETTTFKLVRGDSAEDFVAANADVDAWLKRQPGYRLRRIAVQEDETIMDMLLWESVSQAESAIDHLMDELRDSPVHTMIDQRTVSWNVALVIHAMAVLGRPT